MPPLADPPPDLFHGINPNETAPVPTADLFHGIDPQDPTQQAVNKIQNNVVPLDKAAEATKIGTQVGVHPDIVKDDLDGYKRDAAAQKAATVIGQDPYARSWANSEYLAPALAENDWQILRDIGQKIYTGNFGEERGSEALKIMLSPLTALARTPENAWNAAKQAWQEFKEEQDQSLNTGRPSPLPLWPARFLGREGMVALGAVTSFFAPGAEAALTGLTDAGRYLGLPEDQLALLGLAIAHRGSMRGAFDPAARQVGPAGEAAGVDPAPQPLTPQARANMTQREIFEATAAFHGEFEPSQIKDWSSDELRNYLLRRSGMGEAAQKVSEAGVEVPRGADPVIDRANIETTDRELMALDDAFKKVNDLQLKEKSPEAVERFLDQQGLLKDKDIWIDAQAVKDLYGEDTPHEGDGKFGYLDSASQRIEDAILLGQEINLPRAKFLAHTDEATYGSLKPFLRLRDGGFNAHEAASQMEAHNPENSIAAEAALAEASDVAPITEETVPTSEEVFAEGDKAAEQRKTEAAAEQEEGEAAPVEPAIDPEVRPALDRYEAESRALTGQYEPSEWAPAMEDIKTKPGANTARLALLLGPKLYGEPTHMTTVTVKELLQNSFDAIKALIDKDPTFKGRIEIELNHKDRIIRMTDNGTGMAPEVLGKQFLEIAGTNKETMSASGGLGIAKMLTTFANKGMYVMTYRDGVLSELTTSGDELFQALEDPDKAPMIKTSKKGGMKDIFPDGHGTYVEITIPEDYKDTSTGETKQIGFPEYIDDHAVLKRSPLFGNIEVKYNSQLYGDQVLPIGSNFPMENYQPFFQTKFDWGEATIYMTNKKVTPYYNQNTHILSNGLWQFSIGMKKDPTEPYGDDIERDFFVDVRPRVRPEHAGYPIDLNRQGFTADAKKDFQKIFNYISQIFQSMDISESAINFGNIQYLTTKGVGVEVSEKSPLIPPVAGKSFIPGLKPGDKIEIKDGKLTVAGKVIPELTPEQMKEGKVDISELKVDPSLIKTDQVMLHNNLEIFVEQRPTDPLEQVPYPTPGQWVDLVDAAREEFGPQFDKFMYVVGHVFHRLRDSVAELIPQYKDLKKEGVGISFDPGYRGVSIRVPFSGSFINPALTKYEDPEEAAVGVYGTMVHELAHHAIRSHNKDFPAAMQDILINITVADIMKKDFVLSQQGALNGLIKTYKENQEVFNWLREKLNAPEERLRHKGTRLKGTDEPRTKGGLARDLPGPGDVQPSLQEPGGEGDGDFGLGSIRNPGASGKGFLPSGTAAQVGAAMLHAEKKSLYLAGLFKDQKVAQASAKAWQWYSRRLEEQDQGDYDKILAKAMKEVKKRLTPEFKKDFQEAKAAVTTDLFNQPNIIVNRYFRFGDLPTGEKVDFRPKLETKAVKGMVEEGALRGLTSKDGIHPDDAAQLLGMQSGKELVDMLAAFDKDRGRDTPEKYLTKLINDAAMKKVDKKWGNIQEKMSYEAQQIAREKHHFEILDFEMRQLAALASKYEGLPFTIEQLEDMTKEIFERVMAKEATTKTYQRAMWKGAKEAEVFLLKKDYRRAMMAKMTQIRAGYALQEAEQFEIETKRAEELFDRISGNARLQAVDDEHLQFMQDILTRLGRGRMRAVPQRPFSQFLDENPQVAVASWIRDPSMQRRDMRYENMNVEERRALYNSIDSMYHSGREAKLIDSVHGKADLDNVVFEIKQKLARFPEIPLHSEATFRQRAMEGVRRWLFAPNLLVERMLDYTDQFDRNGPLTTYIDRPLREGFNKEIRLTEAAIKKLKTLHPYTDGSVNDAIDNQVIKYRGELRTLTRHNARVIGLYAGSKGGMKELTKGLHIQEADVWDLLAKSLTGDDVKWLNGIWDLHDQLWKEANEVEKRTKGVEADPIEATPRHIMLSDGKTYRLNGGYMRKRYDKTRSEDPNDLAVNETGSMVGQGIGQTLSSLGIGKTFSEGYVTATNPQKWALPKVGKTHPLDLDATMYLTDLKGMIHDIAFREPILSVRKLLKHGGFRGDSRAKWGVAFDALWGPWLDDIANFYNHDVELAQGAARALSTIRNNTISALTAGNLVTLMKHGTMALGMSVANVGVKGMAEGMAELGVRGIIGPLKDLMNDQSMAPDENFSAAFRQITADTPKGHATRMFILNSSPLMRQRVRPYWDNIRVAWQGASEGGALPTYRSWNEYFQSTSRIAIGMADAVSSFSEWLKAYKETFEKSGDHDLAVNAGDRAVSRAHGSPFIGDKPAIVRLGGELTVPGQFFKMMTALMNFWLHNFNNNLQMGWDMAAVAKGREEPGAYYFRKPDSFPETRTTSISMRFLTGVILAIASEELGSHWMRKSGHSFGYDTLMATTNWAASSFGGIRDIANYYTEGRDPSFGVLGSFGHFVHMSEIALKNMKEGKAQPRNSIMFMYTLLGMLGAPIGSLQGGRTLQGAVNWASGKAVPHGPGEAARQMIFGYPRPLEPMRSRWK